MEETENRPKLSDAVIAERVAANTPVFQRMVLETQVYVSAICKPLAQNEEPYVGTATFVQLAGKYYLLTAAHVVCEAQAQGGLFYFNGENRPFMLVRGPIFAHPGLDIA